MENRLSLTSLREKRATKQRTLPDQEVFPLEVLHLLPINASSGVAEEVSEEVAFVVDRHVRDATMAMTTTASRALTTESATESVDVVVAEEVLAVVDPITEDSIAEDLRETLEADHH
jgi:hypothetical protein